MDGGAVMTQPEPTNPPGEALPPGVHLPRPTVWPMVLAGGIALLLAGLVISFIFSVAGMVLFGLALAGWIRELRRE
jgi:hypothetical protein